MPVSFPHSSSNSIVTDSVVTFLEKIPPFQFLPSSEIRSLARSLTLEYFPKDTVILSAGHRASESLYIVQKGAVKLALRTQIGKELVLDMRSEGEIFGVLSLIGRDVARLDAGTDGRPRPSRFTACWEGLIAAFDCSFCGYSARSAIMGSTMVARRAGKNDAVKAISPRKSATATKIGQSRKLMP